jgi:hypothetical protein
MNNPKAIQIGWNDLHFIGGPVSFSVLEPTNKIGKHAPPLLLLGDHHRCRKGLCNAKRLKRTHKKQGELLRIVYTNTPLWFRLLDLYGTNNYPVSYYIETFLLIHQEDNETTQLKWQTTVGFNSFMNYINQFYPECITSSSCISSFIQYKMSDLRVDMTQLELSPEAKSIQKMLALDQKRDRSKVYNSRTIPRVAQKFTAQPNLSFETASKIINDHMSSEALPFYESQVWFYLCYFATLRRVEQEHKEMPQLLGFSGAQIVQLVLQRNYSQVANVLLNPSMRFFKKHSKLYETMTDDYINNSLQFAKDYIKYFYSCHFDKSLGKKMKGVYGELVSVEQVLNRLYRVYDQETTVIQLHQEYMSSSTMGHQTSWMVDDILTSHPNLKKDFDLICKLASNQYPKACIEMTSVLLAPLNDLYMLFDSYKPSSLCVYNAGNAHISTLYHFLVSNQYYSTPTGLIGRDDISGPISDHHCISFENTVNLDRIIYSHYSTPEQQAKRELVVKRRNAFGEDLFLKILSGKVIDPSSLLSSPLFQAYQEETQLRNFSQVMQDLQIEHVQGLVPKEYLTQTQNYN